MLEEDEQLSIKTKKKEPEYKLRIAGYLGEEQYMEKLRKNLAVFNKTRTKFGTNKKIRNLRKKKRTCSS